MFDLKRPCAQCPFRTDIKPYLRAARAQEIVDAMVEHDGAFPCHKTIEHNEEGEGVMSRSSQHCAGALILLEKIDKPNQVMRTFERFCGGLPSRRQTPQPQSQEGVGQCLQKSFSTVGLPGGSRCLFPRGGAKGM